MTNLTTWDFQYIDPSDEDYDKSKNSIWMLNFHFSKSSIFNFHAQSECSFLKKLMFSLQPKNYNKSKSSVMKKTMISRKARVFTTGIFYLL